MLLLVDDEDVRVAKGGELDTSEGASKFDGELPTEFDVGNEPNKGNGKF